ncbi:hypothetical protein BH09PLA1_BH09PLA1_21360 [soil metagenome]
MLTYTNKVATKKLPGRARRGGADGQSTDGGAHALSMDESADMQIRSSAATAEELWPADVDLILSALDAGKNAGSDDRRLGTRTPYRVRAHLRLFSDQPGAERYTLYTRDVDPRGMGFITSHRLPLGYGGDVELFTPRGNKVRIHCTLLRCRQAAPGWYEGAAYFNREQWMFQVE